MKQGLLWFDVKVIFKEPHENALDMVMMNSLRLGVHKDVVQRDHHKNIGHILKDIVHKVLKCVGKSHWHDKEFKGAIMGLKHCFPFVTRGDANIVVSGAHVTFGVDFGQTKLVNEVRDQWYGVSILSGNLVEVLKVNTELKGAIFLFGK